MCVLYTFISFTDSLFSFPIFPFFGLKFNLKKVRMNEALVLGNAAPKYSVFSMANFSQRLKGVKY